MTSHLVRLGTLLGLAAITGLSSTAMAARPQFAYRPPAMRSAVPPIIVKKVQPGPVIIKPSQAVIIPIPTTWDAVMMPIPTDIDAKIVLLRTKP
ncbi:MAG TPA: hypothetical protein PLL20_07565 [Phycisphaerae bacterium]|nr:hypothetical protein [Phycisphaerae bacterium]HRR86540.1 hypothetical protein [Phycisphaerae bacterium]